MPFRRFSVFLLLPLLLALVGCDIEREIEKLLGAITQFFWELSFERSDDPLLTELTESVGLRVAEVSPRKDMPIKFKVLNVGEANAVTLPNGRIYVFRGMLETADTEDEFAAVLAHEVGHVAGRHSLKQFRLSLGISLLADLLNLNKQSEFVQNLANLAVMLYELGYSRRYERDADTYALRLALLSGYDPKGSIELFDKFARREGKPSRLLIYLSTHPHSTERLERAKRANEDLGRIHPELPAFAAHTLVGAGYSQRGLYRHAALHYEKAIQLQPKHVPALLGLAQAKEALGEFEEAHKWYERVLEIEPQNEEARQGLKRLELSPPASNQSQTSGDIEQRIAMRLKFALSEWEIVQRQWEKRWQMTTEATNAAVEQVRTLWSQMRSMPLQSKPISITFGKTERRSGRESENPFLWHDEMRFNNLIRIRDEVADKCARTLIAFQIATAELESLIEDAQLATRLWRRSLEDWQQLVAQGKNLPEGLVDASDTCSRILFQTAIAAEQDSQSVSEMERQLARVVMSLAEAVNLMQHQRSSFVWMSETKLQIAKSNLNSVSSELQSFLAKMSKKRTQVDKALISAYQTRLSALEAKTPANIVQKVVAYYLRVSEDQVASFRSKLPNIGNVAIIFAFAKVKRVEPEKLIAEINFNSDWIGKLVGNRAPSGVRVALKWLTNAWERDWDLIGEKEKQKSETEATEASENDKK